MGTTCNTNALWVRLQMFAPHAIPIGDWYLRMGTCSNKKAAQNASRSRACSHREICLCDGCSCPSLVPACRSRLLCVTKPSRLSSVSAPRVILISGNELHLPAVSVSTVMRRQSMQGRSEGVWAPERIDCILSANNAFCRSRCTFSFIQDLLQGPCVKVGQGVLHRESLNARCALRGLFSWLAHRY